MKKVGLLTTFYEAESGYSLVTVASTQLRMLLDHGYDPVALVQADFRVPQSNGSVWKPEMIELRRAVPKLDLDESVPEDFEARVQKIKAGLDEGLDGIQVVITHDIILQKFYRAHNVAMRRYARENPDTLWLHWIHSVPDERRRDDYPLDCRYTPPPGYIIYPNEADRPVVIRNYGLEGQEHRVVACRAGHSIDPLLAWNYTPLAKELARRADLLTGDVVAVYPVRPDRNKQIDKIVRLMGGVYRAGYEPRLLVIDWQSTGERFQRYIDELLTLAESLGIAGKLNFTSRLDNRCEVGVPHASVIDLMDLANTFFLSSASETYSIIVQEAFTRGLLVVLNYDLRAMSDLFGYENAVWMDFGSDVVPRTYGDDEQGFWNAEALRLIAELKRNRALMARTTARKEWTPQALWRDFEYLLHLEPVE